MNCKNCGNIIGQNDKICPKCGVNISMNETNAVPFVNAESMPPIVEETAKIPQVQETYIAPNVIENQVQEKRKNPNTVLYIVLAVVVLVAIVCLTLVITQNR